MAQKQQEQEQNKNKNKNKNKNSTRDTICKDGESKKEDCNTCQCHDGQWACTLKACISPATLGTTDAICKDGESKKEDCNTCQCHGGQWACTLKACFSPATPEPQPLDKCIGESCKCPPGMTGVQPFCRPKEEEEFDPEECQKDCTREFRPVCDNLGVTHPNRCAFNIAACK